jgi:glycerol-3-phosphate cytidylyltransferase
MGAVPTGGEPVVGYAAGAFDLFHVGHLNLLRSARSRCDYLIAAVVSDDLVEQRKGARPVVPLAERLAIVSAIRYVDDAVPEVSSRRLDLWKQKPFTVVFKGNDWEGTPAGIALEAEYATVGVRVSYLPYTPQTSSTMLREALGLLLSRPRTELAAG